MEEPVRSLPPGLSGTLTNIVMQMYKGDPQAVAQLGTLVTRYMNVFFGPEFKQEVVEMIDWYNRASDLMSRLANEKLQNILTEPTAKATVKLYFGRLDDDIEGYAGEEICDQFDKSEEADFCDTPMQEGFLIHPIVKARAYAHMLILLHMMMRRVEEFAGADIPSRLGFFVALQAERFMNGIIQGANLYGEERTALMMFAAAAISPNSEFDVSRPESRAIIEEIMTCAVTITGLRFATHFSSEIGGFEKRARKKWFDLWTSERAAGLQSWIKTTSESTGYSRKLVLVPQPDYGEEYALSQDGYFDGDFPTPFLEVPDLHWKRSILSDEAFPTDVLQGTIPLVPIKSRYLDLSSSMKQTQMFGIISPKGGGKTTLQNAIACWSIDRGVTVLRLSTPRDQGLTVVLPSMPSTREEKHDWNYLTKQLKLRPRGYPAKFITVIEDDSDLNPASTYTAFDVFVCVDSLEGFHLPWKDLLLTFGVPHEVTPRAQALMRELEVSKPTPSRPKVSASGYFMVRQLADKARTDMMRSSLIPDFFDYRLNDRSKPIRLQVDEVQDVFGAMFSSPGEAAVVREMQSNFADIRGLNLSFDFGAIRPASLQPEILEYVTTFCFGELRESGAERTHSTRGRMLEAVEPRLGPQKAFIPLMEKIMENIPMGDLKLFFMLNTDDGTLRLVRPMLPPHCMENPKLAPRQQFEAYEQETHESLLRSVNEVERIYVKDGGRGRGKHDRPAFTGLDGPD